MQAEAAENSGPSTADELGFERVVFFSDAVFAIVITLLVLPLTAEIELPEGGDVAAEVWRLWPEALSFAVSFLVIGQFWLAHHRMFAHLQRHDPGLLWFNLISLLTVSFMPFPTAVLGAHSAADDSFPVVFYAASMSATSLCFTGMWLYAVHRHLTDNTMGQHEIRLFTLRSLTTSSIFVLSIAAAFAGLTVAVVFWLVLLPLARASLGFTRRGSA